MEARRFIPHNTVADYQQWEGDCELWSGVPVAMAPSPAKKDREAKRGLYAAEGVRHYVLANPRTRSVEAMSLVGEASEPYGGDGPGDLRLHEGSAVVLPTSV